MTLICPLRDKLSLQLTNSIRMCWTLIPVCQWSHLVSFRLFKHMMNDVNTGHVWLISHLSCVSYDSLTWPKMDISHRIMGNIQNKRFINIILMYFKELSGIFAFSLLKKKNEHFHFYFDKSTHLRRFGGCFACFPSSGMKLPKVQAWFTPCHSRSLCGNGKNSTLQNMTFSVTWKPSGSVSLWLEVLAVTLNNYCCCYYY